MCWRTWRGRAEDVGETHWGLVKRWERSSSEGSASRVPRLSSQASGPLTKLTAGTVGAVTRLRYFHLSWKYWLDADGQRWKDNASWEEQRRITKRLVWVCDYVRLSVCLCTFFWKSGQICCAPVSSSLSRTTNLVLRRGRINLKYILCPRLQHWAPFSRFKGYEGWSSVGGGGTHRKSL